MLFFYSRKKISKWAYWHDKNKWLFCFAVGLGIALTILLMFITLFVVSGHSLPFFRMVGASLAMLLGGLIIGYLAWSENEEKYSEWLENEHKINKN
jgi:hypothetical protein